MNSIFIIGEQRSGSNLLRLMLNQSPHIAAPHPPHILQRMAGLLPNYGSLAENKNFTLLIDDVCHLIETNPVLWRGISLNRKEILEKCRENSLVAVLGAVMDYYAEIHKAESWVCKSMQNVRWIERLESYFLKPKYIFLYRDPRDVVLSFSKAVVGHKHPYSITKQWVALQELCIKAENNLPENRIFPLKYESLLDDPQNQLMKLCDFLEIEYSDSMLKYYDSQEARNTAKVSTLWSKVINPLNKQNYGKYKKEMNNTDMLIVESLAGEIMDILGYSRQFTNGQLKKFSATEISNFELENKVLIEEMLKKMGKKDLESRTKQQDVLEEIKQRKLLTKQTE